jgi:hypothetical protein
VGAAPARAHPREHPAGPRPRVPPRRGRRRRRPGRRLPRRLPRVLGLPLQPVRGGRRGRGQRAIRAVAPARTGWRLRRSRHRGRDPRQGRPELPAQPGHRARPGLDVQHRAGRVLPALRVVAPGPPWADRGPGSLRRHRGRRRDGPLARRRGPGDVGPGRDRVRISTSVRRSPAVPRAPGGPHPDRDAERALVLGRRRAELHEVVGVRVVLRVLVHVRPAAGPPVRRGRLRRRPELRWGDRRGVQRGRGAPVRRRGRDVDDGPLVHGGRDGPPRPFWGRWLRRTGRSGPGSV